MRLTTGFLKTRVARRILVLFVLCALIPTSALAVVSWTTVRDQLRSQSRERLLEVSKNAGMVVVERLQFLSQRLVGLGAVDDLVGAHPGFAAIAVGRPSAEFRVLDGQLRTPDPLTSGEEAWIQEGNTLVRIRAGFVPEASEIVFVLSRRDEAGREELLWASVDRQFLWNTAEGYASLPTTAGLCIVTRGGEPLYCTVPGVDAFLPALRASVTGGTGERTFGWETPAGEEHLAGFWEAYLEPLFGAPSVTVAVTESRSAVMAPMATFQESFLAVTVLGLVVVGLLSNVQVRKSLTPVEELRKATRRIAERDFGARVVVESGDEFEDLGDSFNAMARRLDAQFSALSTIGEVDRAILSALKPDRIADSILEALPDIVPADRVAVAFLEREDPHAGEIHLRGPGADRESERRALRLTSGELDRLTEHGHHFSLSDDGFTSLLGDDRSGDQAASAGLVAPFFVDGRLAGFVSAGHRIALEYQEDEVERLRQVADQIAVALSNTRLLDDLERLNWGALTALARAIDAKSPWTAGHSERVRDLTARLARALEMDEEEIERLERGALVHDIGKIGIPGRILDKKGRLTGEEEEIMRSHVRVGARILEPIPALKPVLPMVLGHHERWDGSGYPEGLAREEIAFTARVLGVADCFDALVSNRPYRSGWDRESAAGYIIDGAGVLFDPVVVEAFRTVVDQDGDTKIARAESGEGLAPETPGATA